MFISDNLILSAAQVIKSPNTIIHWSSSFQSGKGSFSSMKKEIK
jgi:hypothetical protein